jgi:hypothetical protein
MSLRRKLSKFCLNYEVWFNWVGRLLMQLLRMHVLAVSVLFLDGLLCVLVVVAGC